MTNSIHGRYLGETDISNQHDTDPQEMALLFIHLYGGIDGAHHKDWVLDQVVRILNGASVTVKEAKWEDSYTELRYSVGESDQYHEWVRRVKNGEDGPDTYSYETGIAP